MMVLMMKMMVKTIVKGKNDEDNVVNDTDDYDNDNVTLEIPETQKSPSLAW